MFYTKQTRTTKVDMRKQNNKMKLADQHLKFMLKKAQVEQDTQVEKHQSLLVVV